MMAGLDDYQFYTNLKDKDSPFWQKCEEPQDFEQIELAKKFKLTSDTPKQVMEYDLVKDGALEKYGDVSFTVISVCAENLLSHPFIVLRRQCQVNVTSQRYHLFPFTLLPRMFHLHSHQGPSTLWKGLGSVLTIRGITLALEDFLSKFTPWPKEISPHSSLKMIGQHLLLKATALALITPFYSASLVETVQSEIASEKPGILDVFKEGLYRLLSFTQPQTGRMLPVWLLLIPTVTHGILQYVIGNAFSTVASQFLRTNRNLDQKKQGALSKDLSLSDSYIRLHAAFFGHLTSDILLYPLETILHRLHLQGTRTIIDSLDYSYEVKPILTRYEGFFDCLSTTIREEGGIGLYKGFGALCLQYLMYGAVLKFAHVIIREITAILNPPKPKKPQDYVTPLTPGMAYTPISSIHSGVASLHSSPLRRGGHQRHNESIPHSGSIDFGELSHSEFQKKDIDLRAELDRHRTNLSLDD